MNPAPQAPKPETVHHILAQSYSVYLVALVAGVILHLAFREHFLSEKNRWIGAVLVLLATLLVIWAQRASGKLRHAKQSKGKLEIADFCRGPYCVSRNPTHWGLFLLVVGLGFLLNSILMIGAGIIAFMISKGIFLRKEENLLAQKYGEEYLKYKKRVKL